MTAVLLILAVLLCFFPICSHPWLSHPPSSSPPPPPFNPTAKFNWNHSLWFFCEDPFHSYRDTGQSGKEICIDQNGFKVIHNPIKKHKPVFHEGIVKTLMYFYNHCLLYRVFSTAGAGQSCQQLAAWWIQNSVSLSLYFSTFLHPASLLTISPSILPFHFYCVVGFVWFSVGFFPPGLFFFSLFFLLPNSIVTQSECQSKFISI